MNQHSFLFFLKEGKVEFTKEGYIIFLNEGSLILPVRTFNFLILKLKEELKEKFEKFLNEIAKYQVGIALKRYKKTLGIDNVAKEKILEFATKIIEALGIGKPKFEKISKEGIVLKIPATIFSHEYVLEHGYSKEPFDVYFKYLMKNGMEIIFGGKYKVEEIKCYAKGDDCCLFIAKKIK